MLPSGVCLLSQAAPIPEGAKQPAPYFPTRVGTRWVYLDGKEEVTVAITDRKQVNDTAIVTVHGVYPDGALVLREKVAVSREGVTVVESTFLSQSDPGIPWVKTKAKSGDNWELDTWYQVGDSRTPVIGNMSVIGTEKVDVPAGSFTAIRMKPKCKWWGPSEERWYAPGVGIVKYALGPSHVITLKSFMLGKE